MCACSVLAIEPTAGNALRVATFIHEGLPDLIRMPGAPLAPLGAAPGEVTLRVDGKPLSGATLHAENLGVLYGWVSDAQPSQAQRAGSDAWSQDLGVPEPRNTLADRLGFARAAPHALDGKASRAQCSSNCLSGTEKDRQSGRIEAARRLFGSVWFDENPGPRPASRRLAGITKKKTRCAALGSVRSMTGQAMQRTPLGSCAWWQRGAFGGQSQRLSAGAGVRWRCERDTSNLRNFRLRFAHALPTRPPADAACARLGAVELASVSGGVGRTVAHTKVGTRLLASGAADWVGALNLRISSGVGM